MKKVLKKIITTLIVIMLIANYLPMGIIKAEETTGDDSNGSWPWEYYDTVEDYLKVYYDGYENVDKSEITEIFLDSLDRCKIKDFSGIYDYPNLTSLKFWGFDIDINLDLSKFPKLEEFYGQYVSIQSIDCTKNRNLKKLDLLDMECETIDLSNLSLEHLGFVFHGENSKINITGIGNSIQSLKSLNISGHLLSKIGMEDVSEFKNLERLEVTENMVQGIEKLENLKELSLNHLDWKDKYAVDFSKLSKLTKLELNVIWEADGSGYKDISKLGIEKLENLKELSLSWVRFEYNLLSNLSNLTSLVFNRVYEIDGETYKDISKLEIEKLKNLKYLETSHLRNSLSLTRNSKLENIVIYNIDPDFSGKTIDVRGLENLKEFYLSFYTSEVSGFEADKCILIDEELEVYTIDDYISYSYYSYDIDLELPASYITDKVTEDIRGEEKILYGFELTNNKLTIKDLNEGNYIQEGIEYKIYDASGKEVTDTSKGLGTGSKIAIYQDEELVEEYTVVIYGDTTGDGAISALDALNLIKAINKKVQYIDPMCEEAGKILTKAEEKKPSAVDALAIIKHLNKKYEIQQGM